MVLCRQILDYFGGKDMKKSLIGMAMALVLICTMVLGCVQVFAEISPYQEFNFADEPDDWEQEEVNEFHHDILKFEEKDGIPNVGGTFDGSWLEYDGFSFGGVGAVAIKVNYCNNSGRCAADSQIEVWVDGKSTEDGGTKVGTVDLPATADNWDTYEEVEVQLDTVVTGDHDIYMVLVGTTSTTTPFISNLRTFEFVKGEGEEPTVEPTATPEETVAPTEEPTPEPTATPEETEEATQTPKTTTEAPKVTTQVPSQIQDATDDTQENGDNGIVIVIVIVAAVVIAAAVAAFVILKKKKG